VVTKQFLVVAGLSLTAALWFVGCSESNVRRTSKNLNDATAMATRLSQRAVDLQANPMFRYVPDNKFNPLPADMGPLVKASQFSELNTMIKRNDPPETMLKEHQKIADLVKGKVELVQPGTIHPEVKACLEKAREVLLKALDEAGDTPGIEGAKAVAMAKLGSVRNMLGQVYWQEFTNARAKSFAMLEAVDASVDQSNREQALIASLEIVLKQGATTYESAYEAAQQMQGEAQGKLKALQGKMDDIKAKQAELQTAITDLTQQANQKQIAAKGEDDPTKAEVLFDETAKLQDQAMEKMKAMQALDEELDSNQGLASIEQAKLAALSGKAGTDSAPTSQPTGTVDAASDMVAKAKAMLADVAAARDDAQTRLKDSQALTAKTIKELAAAYKGAVDVADAKAAKEFEAAISRCQASNVLANNPTTKATEGDAARNYASLRMQQRQLVTAVAAVVKQANGNLADVIGSADAVKLGADWGKAAADKYGDSAKAFAAAATSLGRDSRSHQAWAYWAAAAQSQMGLAMADDKARPEAMKQAGEQLGKATQGRTKSPYLEYVLQVQSQYYAMRDAGATTATN